MGVLNWGYRVVNRMVFLAFAYLFVVALIHYDPALVQRILDDTIGAFFSWISGL